MTWRHAGPAAENAPTSPTAPATTTVDVSLRHPNGTVLTVDTITCTDTTIETEMEVRNGHTEEVEPGEAVSGTRALLGPRADDAGSVSVVWGLREPGDYSLDREHPGTIFPGFVVRDLPVG